MFVTVNTSYNGSGFRVHSTVFYLSSGSIGGVGYTFVRGGGGFVVYHVSFRTVTTRVDGSGGVVSRLTVSDFVSDFETFSSVPFEISSTPVTGGSRSRPRERSTVGGGGGVGYTFLFSRF